MTINNTWAYNKHDLDFKSSQVLIRMLVEVASRGGNFLLNVGRSPTEQYSLNFKTACVRSANGCQCTASRFTKQPMARSRELHPSGLP